MRRWVQGISALAQNAYLAFPWTRDLYRGPLKGFCTPSLNCYSCPAAVVSCPLGTLQHFLAAVRPALRWGTYRLGFYVVGFLLGVGLLFGRFPCGWLCPFGLLQDGLYKLPAPKMALPRRLGYVRYAVLGILVLALPLAVTNALGYGDLWFCKLLCPAGTLEGGGLFFIMPGLRGQVGALFLLKGAVLAGVIGWAATTYRPYCRSLCPLGALYGYFNRWSLLRVEHDPSRCVDCRSCVESCEVELDPRRQGGSAICLRCFGCARHNCPEGALTIRLGPLQIHPKPCDPASAPAEFP